MYYEPHIPKELMAAGGPRTGKMDINNTLGHFDLVNHQLKEVGGCMWLCVSVLMCVFGGDVAAAVVAVSVVKHSAVWLCVSPHTCCPTLRAVANADRPLYHPTFTSPHSCAQHWRLPRC